MRDPVTILFSSAGRRNQLMDCFRAAARNLGTEARVLAADMNPDMSPACRAADAAFAVPRCTAPEFHERIQGICRDEGVQLVIPTIDTELPGYARERAAYERAKVCVAVSSPEVVDLARDKMRFHEFLAKRGLPTPHTGEATALDAAGLNTLPWPCVFKPRGGSRSVGILRANNPGEVPEKILRNPAYLWQECWTGREFTVHFFLDRAGSPVGGVIPCERLEVRDGEVSKGATRKIPALEDAVHALAEALGERGGYGPHCAQGIVRAAGQQVVLFEMNARFGGGYPLADNAGAPFARRLIQDALGISEDTAENWRPDRIMLRYDTARFFDK